MKTFKTFFEDFNNWRKPSGAGESDKNCTWTGSNPAGFKGDGGSYVGRMMQLDFKAKIPKEKQSSRSQELRDRKRRQKKSISLYKQSKQISDLLLGKR